MYVSKIRSMPCQVCCRCTSGRSTHPALKLCLNQCRWNTCRTSIVNAVGRSPASIAEAFFQSSISTNRSPSAETISPLVASTQHRTGSDAAGRSGPDAVVSFLSDDILAAAFEHARQLRCLFTLPFHHKPLHFIYCFLLVWSR